MKRFEFFKNILIAFLFITAIVMAGQLWLTRGFAVNGVSFPQKYAGTPLERLYKFLSNTDDAEGINEIVTQQYLKASIIGIKQAKDLHCALYGETQMQECSFELGNLLHDMLSNSSAFSVLNDKTASDLWSLAIAGNGIYTDFGHDIPVLILRRFLNIDNFNRDDYSLRFVFIKKLERSFEIYFLNDSKTTLLTASVDIKESNFYSILGNMIINNGVVARFAFDENINGSYSFNENGGVINVQPDLLLLMSRLPKYAISSESKVLLQRFGEGFIQPNTEYINSVISAFGYNVYNINSYPLVNSLIYVEVGSTININTSNLVLYNSQTAETGLSVSEMLSIKSGETMDAGHYAKAAKLLISRIGQTLAGGSAASLELYKTVYNSSDGSYDYYFRYMSGGIYIENNNEKSSCISIKHGYIYRAELYLEQYSEIEEFPVYLPSAFSVLSLKSAEATDAYIPSSYKIISGLYLEFIKTDIASDKSLLYPRWIIEETGGEIG